MQVKIIVSLAGCSISTYNIAKGQLWLMELCSIFIVLPTVATGFDEIVLTKEMSAIRKYLILLQSLETGIHKQSDNKVL